MKYVPTEQRPPAEQRSLYIHFARVHLAEARRRRVHKGFSATLLQWAANSRRRAAGVEIPPALQRSLNLGGAA